MSNVINTENSPFEANYESAKQSVIGFLGEVARAYDLPAPLINILVYEIALEARNASFSAIVGNCEVTYPEEVTNQQNSQVISDPAPTQETPQQNPEPVSVDMSSKKGEVTRMKAEDAIKELEKMSVSVTNIDKPSDDPQEQSA